MIKLGIKAWSWRRHLDYSVFCSDSDDVFCMWHGYVQMYSTPNNVLEVIIRQLSFSLSNWGHSAVWSESTVHLNIILHEYNQEICLGFS